MKVLCISKLKILKYAPEGGCNRKVVGWCPFRKFLNTFAGSWKTRPNCYPLPLDGEPHLVIRKVLCVSKLYRLFILSRGVPKMFSGREFRALGFLAIATSRGAGAYLSHKYFEKEN
jgi:hypothetical protein